MSDTPAEYSRQVDDDIQLTLFDAQPVPGADVALCPVCRVRPVKWRPRSLDWADYCGGRKCSSPRRLCRHCGAEFLTSAGGTRYCSADCLYAHHHTAKQRQLPMAVVCPVDGTEHRGRNVWGLCADCFESIRAMAPRLRRHRVPQRLVVALVKDPTCQVPGCSVDLGQVHFPPHRLVVDHDHSHCPGPMGCERCVRGLICQGCNVMLGFAKDNADLLIGAAAYLRTWQRRGATSLDELTAQPPLSHPGGTE